MESPSLSTVLTDDPVALAAAAGFHSVAATLSAHQQRSESSTPSQPRTVLPVSRRLGRSTRVKTFVWKPERAGPPPKAKDPAEFREIARREAELAAEFTLERNKYDKYLNPGNVKPEEGTRENCGRRSVSLRQSGSSTFAKVKREAETLSITHGVYPIQPNAPLEMDPGLTGATVRKHDTQSSKGTQARTTTALSSQGDEAAVSYLARRHPVEANAEVEALDASNELVSFTGATAASKASSTSVRSAAGSTGRLYFERVPTPPRVDVPMIASPERYERTQSDNVLVRLRAATQRRDRKAVREIVTGRASSGTAGVEPTSPFSPYSATSPTSPSNNRSAWGGAAARQRPALQRLPSGSFDSVDSSSSNGSSGGGGGEGGSTAWMASLLGCGRQSSSRSSPHRPIGSSTRTSSAVLSGGQEEEEEEPLSPPSSSSSSAEHRHLLTARQHARSVLELDVNTPGPTALHVACENGFLDLVSELLKLGASTTAQAQSDMTPLHLCAQQGHLECASALLSRGGPAQLVLTTRRKRTALHVAVSKGDLAMVRLLLDAISHAGRSHGTKMAIEKQQKEALEREDRKMRLEASLSNEDAIGEDDQLSGGGGRGRRRSSSISSEGAGGDSVASLSSSSSSSAGEAVLVGSEKRRGPKLTQKQQVAAAGAEGAERAVKAFVNTCDEQGSTVLHDAARVGNLEVGRLLLEGGARPQVRLIGGARRTPAELALEGRHIPLAQLINDYAAVRGKFDWFPAGLRGLFDTDLPKHRGGGQQQHHDEAASRL